MSQNDSENKHVSPPKPNMTIKQSTMNEDVFPIETWGFSSNRHVSELRGVNLEGDI